VALAVAGVAVIALAALLGLDMEALRASVNKLLDLLIVVVWDEVAMIVVVVDCAI
jgi:hypothetical protein